MIKTFPDLASLWQWSQSQSLHDLIKLLMVLSKNQQETSHKHYTMDGILAGNLFLVSNIFCVLSIPLCLIFYELEISVQVLDRDIVRYLQGVLSMLLAMALAREDRSATAR